MATPKKNKSGNYTILLYDYQDETGKQHYKRYTAPTKKEVLKLAANHVPGELRNKIPKEPLRTVDDALTEYIEVRTPILSPSTIRGYNSTLLVFRKEFPEFMNRSVNSITERDMQKFVSIMSETKSPKTVQNYKALICSISDRFKEFNIVTPMIVQYEPYIPTEAEIMALLDGCIDTEIEVPIMLGAYCMMRRGEICALDIKDVDFVNKKIHIRHAYARNQHNRWVIKPPKTKSSYRSIDVADFVLEKIKKKGYITNLLPDQLTERFERKLVSLNLHKFRFHDLRHFCCSIFAYKNIGVLYTQKFGGWSNPGTVQKIYQHILRDKKDEIYDNINSYFSKNYHEHNSIHNSENIDILASKNVRGSSPATGISE